MHSLRSHVSGVVAVAILGSAAVYFWSLDPEPDQSAVGPLAPTAPGGSEPEAPDTELEPVTSPAAGRDSSRRTAEPSKPPAAPGRVIRVHADYATPDPVPELDTTLGAVWHGLHWLGAHQSRDGSWDLGDLHPRADTDARALADPGLGAGPGDVAATSLALLAFLADRQTMTRGRHKDAVSRGMKWLVAQQDGDSGRIGPWEPGDPLRAHAIATLALCEAYRIDRSILLKFKAQLAVDYIVQSRRVGGVWALEGAAGSRSSNRVSGWLACALRAAQAAKLNLEGDVQAAIAAVPSGRSLPGQEGWASGAMVQLGDVRGSWDPTEPMGSPYGSRTGATALAVICLRAKVED